MDGASRRPRADEGKCKADIDFPGAGCRDLRGLRENDLSGRDAPLPVLEEERMTDMDTLRAEHRALMAADPAAAFAEIGQCGDDMLPCGVCAECREHAAALADSHKSQGA